MTLNEYAEYIARVARENTHAGDWPVTNPQDISFYPFGESVTLVAARDEN